MNLFLRLALRSTFLIVAGVFAGAAPGESAQAGCHSARSHDFDFWLGTWTVRSAAGKVLGRSVITSAQDGCVIADSWQSTRGHTGQSLSIYNAESGRWHETWVDGGGGLLLLEGGRAPGAMLLSGRSVDRSAKNGYLDNTMRWTALVDGRVRLLWQTSGDGGKTWRAAFEGYYTRKNVSAQETRVRTTFAGRLPLTKTSTLKMHVVEVTYPPGGATKAHSHPCPVSVYVIAGALREQVANEPATIVTAGQSFYEPPNSVHAVSANGSDSKQAKFLATFVCDRDTRLSIPLPRLTSRGGRLS